jgi:hypothetical protein
LQFDLAGVSMANQYRVCPAELASTVPWLVLTVLIPEAEAAAGAEDEPLPEVGVLAAELPQAASAAVATARPATASHRFLI